MEENNKKEELNIYNLYRTLNILLEKIKQQSGKELENIGIVYNKKLVEVGNQFKENNLTFSKATELTNTINNKMMLYIKSASGALDEYIKVIESEKEKNNDQIKKISKNNIFKRIFRISERENNITTNDRNINVKENLSLSKYDEMVCKLKLFKIEKDISVAIDDYIELNKHKGDEFITKYKENVIKQLEQIGIKL